MTQQKGRVGGTLSDNSTTYNGGHDTDTSEHCGVVPLTDMLTYMADMLGELQSIADKNNLQTLSGLLALSHAEAMIRRDEFSVRRATARGG